MSPEYALDGLFSFKSDVFSFGVVVIETISGKRNTGFHEPEKSLSLLGYVSDLRLFRTHNLFQKCLTDKRILYNKCAGVGTLERGKRA